METAGLTLDRLKALLRYDPETGKFTRLTSQGGCRVGAEIVGNISKRGYASISVDGKLYRANRLAWFYMTGKWPDPECDHENRKRSDNRWVNLREVDHFKNMQNTGTPKNNTSGHVGVTLDKENGKWRAEIMANGERYRLGRFDSIEAAAAARMSAKAELHAGAI